MNIHCDEGTLTATQGKCSFTFMPPIDLTGIIPPCMKNYRPFDKAFEMNSAKETIFIFSQTEKWECEGQPGEWNLTWLFC